MADKTDGYHKRVKVKVKVISFYDLPRRHRWDRQVWHYSFFNIGDRKGCVVNGMPRPLCPKELPGTQGRFGRVRKISPTPGFDIWTLQPVASRYTDYATPDHITNG